MATFRDDNETITIEVEAKQNTFQKKIQVSTVKRVILTPKSHQKFVFHII